MTTKVEAYKSQNGLTQYFHCQRFGHTAVHRRLTPRCVCCGGAVNVIANDQRNIT